MKIVKWVIIPVVILCAIGFGLYRFGINYTSDKLVDTVSQQLEASGEMETVKKVIESDPALEGFIKETETQNNQGNEAKTEQNEAVTTLPFDTKEEAIEVVTKKVGISTLQDLAQGYQDGTTSKEEIIEEVSSKLTEDEIKAVKIIVYKELYMKE